WLPPPCGCGAWLGRDGNAAAATGGGGRRGVATSLATVVGGTAVGEETGGSGAFRPEASGAVGRSSTGGRGGAVMDASADSRCDRGGRGNDASSVWRGAGAGNAVGASGRCVAVAVGKGNTGCGVWMLSWDVAASCARAGCGVVTTSQDSWEV